MYDELAQAIDAGRSRLEVSSEQMARHLTGSPFAIFAASVHSGGVAIGSISAPSYAAALCSTAASVNDAAKGFIDEMNPEKSRENARRVYDTLRSKLGSLDLLGQLREIGNGIKAELVGAEEAGVTDVRLLRHMMRATYGNVERLLVSLASAG